MDDIKLLILQATQQAFPEVKGSEALIELQRPTVTGYGDWTTNVALRLSAGLKTAPRTVAETIVSRLEANIDSGPGLIHKIEVAGPGFINFTLNPNYYFENLAQISDKYGQTSTDSPLRIIVEMGDPNTHKMPHIGHLFNYIAGDSIARLLASQGHVIKRVSWQGDVGPHVAKCIYGWRAKGKPTATDIVRKMTILQDSYVYGSELYSEPEHLLQIKALNKLIYAQDPSVYSDWLETKEWSLEFDEFFERMLGIKLDQRYLEGDLWKKGMDIVRANLGPVFVESEGAIVFPGEKVGLHTRVFITKESTPTYEAKELGLNTQKMEDFPYDLTVIPTADEQTAYFKVVIKALEASVPALTGKIKHIGTGMINLTTGKMSSRSGNIVTGYGLVDIVQKRVQEVMSDRDSLKIIDKEQVVRAVTMGAIKYAFLRGNILQNMTFNLEESISFEGNSGPYLQYTYARIQSVLRHSNVTSIDSAQPGGSTQPGGPVDLQASLVIDSELSLVKKLERYPEVVVGATESYSPHLIANYLFDLAQQFNSYYKANSINSAETVQLVTARRQLSEKVSIVLAAGLNLLGIEVVAQM